MEEITFVTEKLLLPAVLVGLVSVGLVLLLAGTRNDQRKKGLQDDSGANILIGIWAILCALFVLVLIGRACELY